MATKLQTFLNSPITHVALGRGGAKAGDLFGFELEVEGKNVSLNQNDLAEKDLLRAWTVHADGSLRNHHGDACEWVFNGPCAYNPAVARIKMLFDYFQKRKARLVCSNRTSVHIHFNMGDKAVYQLVNMFILFTIFEGLLDRYCGEDRVGNLFCLSSRHAEDQIQWMHDACFTKFSFAGFRDEYRYCSLNIASINKFGSVEFRGMRGLDNSEAILEWFDIVKEFCEYSCYTLKNPVDMIQTISAHTPQSFLRTVFSAKNVEHLTKGLQDFEVHQSIYEGLRLVQMMCYKIGTEFDQVKLRGRDFWASFKDQEEGPPDVDPENMVPPRAPRQRANPFEARLAGAAAELRNGVPVDDIEQAARNMWGGNAVELNAAPLQAWWMDVGDGRMVRPERPQRVPKIKKLRQANEEEL